MAVANYRETHGHFPPAYLADAEGRPMHSWRVLILPFIEQDNLYKQYDFNEPWDSPKNQLLADRMPRIFALHGVYERGVTTTTNYLAVVGPETMWPGAARRAPEDVTDDPASTILIVENKGANVHWMEPRDLSFEAMSFTVGDPAGITSCYKDPAVVTVDGGLFRLKPDLQPVILRALLTARGGERLGLEGDGWQILPDGRQRERRAP